MLGGSLCQCFLGCRRSSHSGPAPAADIAAVSSSTRSSLIVFKHYNSLYNPATESDTIRLTITSTAVAAEATVASTSFSSYSSCSGGAPEDDDDDDGWSLPSELDLSTAIASRRLLPASPGRSNSIVESASIAVGMADGVGVAVPTYSPDPYLDFRRSMEEMVGVLGLNAGDHRARLYELLLCYLALNRKHAHKYILSAFTDLLLALASTTEDGRSSA